MPWITDKETGIMPERGLKQVVQACLKQAGIYHRLRTSSVYDIYWALADPSLIHGQRREREFYREMLEGFQAGDMIYDVGANVGHKTNLFLQLGAKVLAVDPDTANTKVLEESFLRYRLFPKRVTILRKAVSDRSAMATMYLDEPGSAKNTLSTKWVDTLRQDADRFGQEMTFGEMKEVPTTTLEELMDNYGTPFYIKIDVEGHEPQVLRGLRRRVPYLSFEVNLPEFMEEGQECVSILNALATEGEFNYVVDCKAGFVLPAWLKAGDFSALMAQCKERSIEVFWKGGR